MKARSTGANFMTLQLQLSELDDRNIALSGHEFLLPMWLRSRLLVLISNAFVMASLVLFAFPVIDVTLSSLAFDGTNFVVSKIEFIRELREFHKDSLAYILPLTILSIFVYALYQRKLPMLAPHRALFVLGSFGIGALILVHSLKALLGRARPHDTLLFGGDKGFTPVWQIADMCGASCSFPSGESAAAAALLSFVVYASPGMRRPFLATVLPLAVFLSLNRMLVGAHFFSDVLLAWLMVLFVMVSLWRYIEPRAATIDQWVWQAGERTRKVLHRGRAISGAAGTKPAGEAASL